MHVTSNQGSVYAVSEGLPVANVTNANLDFGIKNKENKILFKNFFNKIKIKLSHGKII